MTNYEYLTKNNKLLDFLYELVEMVAALARLQVTDHFKEDQLKILDKFRCKYPTCHPLDPVFISLNISDWLQDECEKDKSAEIKTN